jgi:glucosamine kinase
MRIPEHVLAIDGGGSKTAAALLTGAGDELARCRVGPSNLYRDPAAGLAEIGRAWEELCRVASLDTATAAGGTVISAGLAGASGAAQRDAYAEAFAGFAARRLSSDGYTAFLGVFGSAPGALLSIGTGVVAYICPPDGAPAIRAGWGFPVADRGGGAWLGFRLATEYLDHLDGVDALPRSRLWTTAATTFGTERDAILAWLGQARAADFAALAPAVTAAAADLDPLGTALLDEGCGHLLRLARALAPTAAARLCLGGGLAAVYRSRLEAALPQTVLPATARPNPLRGAWLVATGQAPPEYPDVA